LAGRFQGQKTEKIDI